MSRECQCYTRQYRQLIVPDDLITDGEEQKMIDPTHFLFINSGYRNNSDRLCSILSCRVTSDRMYSTLVHWLRITYRNYASRIDGLATKEWLAVADARSQKLFIDTLFEVRYVLQGEVVPSGDCNNRTNVKRSECLFAKVCYEQGISTQVLSNTLLSSEDEDSILSAALTLFNLMKYDQSEALAFYTLNRLLRAGPISDVVDNHVVHAHINVNIDLTLRVCTIISEILRLRGQIADATTSTLFTITYRDDIGSESGVRIDHGSILYRLRLLLTVPSIPARKDVAEKNRQEMIEDIDKFGTMVRMHRTELSMSIKVCSTECTFPFLDAKLMFHIVGVGL